MISTEPSTFEYTRDWLLSSECFLYDAMGATEPELDDARDEVRPRIHREEFPDEPDTEQESQSAPDTPPSVSPRPRALVRTATDERLEVGTGSWSGRGELRISLEVPVPAEYLPSQADDLPVARATKFAARMAWAEQLCKTIRLELLQTKGLGDAQGNPYLNARDLQIALWPSDPAEEEESGWMGWVYEARWVG